MPTRRRTGLGSSPIAEISSPSNNTAPSSICSSRFTQRSKVVLPLPLAPMSETTSPLATSSDRLRNTVLAPNDLVTPRRLTLGVMAPPECHSCDVVRGARDNRSSE